MVAREGVPQRVLRPAFFAFAAPPAARLADLQPFALPVRRRDSFSLGAVPARFFLLLQFFQNAVKRRRDGDVPRPAGFAAARRDAHDALFQIDVRRRQPQHFGRSHARVEHQPERRERPRPALRLRRFFQRVDFFRRERGDFLLRNPRRRHGFRGIFVGPAFPHREIEDGAEQREPFFPLARLRERRVERAGAVLRRKRPQARAAKIRRGVREPPPLVAVVAQRARAQVPAFVKIDAQRFGESDVARFFRSAAFPLPLERDPRGVRQAQSAPAQQRLRGDVFTQFFS